YQPLRSVIPDASLEDQPAPHGVEVELLFPHLGTVDVVEIEITALEHLELKIPVSDDSKPYFIEVARPHIAALLFCPVVLSAADVDGLALLHILLRDSVRPRAGHHLIVVVPHKACAVELSNDMRRKNFHGGKIEKVSPVGLGGSHAHDVLTFRDWLLKLSVDNLQRGII